MNQKNILKVLRVALGFVFLWAFLDKTFGLGFSTASDKSWLSGASPTSGFLAHAVKGPFINFFHSLSGVALVDWLFMVGLLFVGLTLIFNKYMKWGALAGMAMMLLMLLALLPPENNPIVDDHLIYFLVFAFFFAKARAGEF